MKNNFIKKTMCIILKTSIVFNIQTYIWAGRVSTDNGEISLNAKNIQEKKPIRERKVLATNDFNNINLNLDVIEEKLDDILNSKVFDLEYQEDDLLDQACATLKKISSYIKTFINVPVINKNKKTNQLLPYKDMLIQNKTISNKNNDINQYNRDIHAQRRRKDSYKLTKHQLIIGYLLFQINEEDVIINQKIIDLNKKINIKTNQNFNQETVDIFKDIENIFIYKNNELELEFKHICISKFKSKFKLDQNLNNKLNNNLDCLEKNLSKFWILF